MQEEPDEQPFILEPPEPRPLRSDGVGPLPPPGTGRPVGSKNVVMRPEWQIARKNSPAFLQKLCIWLDARLNRGDVNEIVMRALELVFARTWPKPRPNLAPINIDASRQLNVQVLSLLASGQLSATDAATLLRLEGVSVQGEAGAAAGGDPRKQLGDALAKIVQARQSNGHSSGA